MLRSLLRVVTEPIYAPFRARFDGLLSELERLAVLQGQQLAALHASQPLPGDISSTEFSVFSQFGEDGILQALVSRIAVPNRAFVEIGVEDYWEANTRFLLLSNKWRGLVIDGNARQIATLQRSRLMWRAQLSATSAFVTRENVNSLLSQAGFIGDIGLLSIDVDGMEYWLWDAIDIISPRVVVSEFNRLFGCERTVTVPYSPNFVASQAHASRLYAGASLAALAYLGEKKGYGLVCCTREGINAFFVRNDVLGSFGKRTAQECFQSITQPANGGAWDNSPQLLQLGDLPLVDPSTGNALTVRELVKTGTARDRRSHG